LSQGYNERIIEPAQLSGARQPHSPTGPDGGHAVGVGGASHQRPKCGAGGGDPAPQPL
jgi:hypothetical protein